MHFYNKSCVLEGEGKDEKKLPVNIKISRVDCLGEREFNQSKTEQYGCLKILESWKSGNFNIFVRNKPDYKLSELFLNRNPPEGLSVPNMIRDLAKIMYSMHNNNMFVRFILPQNVVFINGPKWDVKFEEFGTISYKPIENSDAESGKKY